MDSAAPAGNVKSKLHRPRFITGSLARASKGHLNLFRRNSVCEDLMPSEREASLNLARGGRLLPKPTRTRGSRSLEVSALMWAPVQKKLTDRSARFPKQTGTAAGPTLAWDGGHVSGCQLVELRSSWILVVDCGPAYTPEPAGVVDPRRNGILFSQLILTAENRLGYCRCAPHFA